MANRYTGKIVPPNTDITAGMIEADTPNQAAAKKFNDEQIKNWKKLLEEKNKLTLKYNQKALDIISKEEYKKLLDIEKTRKQKREDAHRERIEYLRLEYLMEENEDKKKEIRNKFNAEKMKEIWSSISSTVSNTINKAVDQMDTYIGTYSQYMSAIETRLYGAGKSYTNMTDMIRKNIGLSPYVKQTAVLENLSKLVEQGIAYNVEQRAFLATVSDRIATTFDAFDSNLLQLIRLQQSDSTQARLGIESSLTNFLNKTFGDTSYLTDVSSSVSKALLGVESQLGLERGVEFESTVQKWLGSLYSVGVSSSTIEQIAQGLNYLGTGDVSALSSNESLQRLLVMASQRAGLPYGQMLTGGIDASTASRLLESLVTFGQEIAASNNQVVKSQYANIFGLTISDMTALLNLSSQDLVNISGNMLKYSDALKETSTRLDSIGKRTSMKDKVETAFSNVLAGIGETITSNAALYGTYLAANALISAGDVTIPSVSVMGFSTPEIKVGQAAKTGVVVGAGLANLLGSVVNLFSGDIGYGLNRWGAQETRGGNQAWGRTGITIASYDDVSYSGYLGLSKDSAIYENSLLANKEVSVITGKAQELTDILNEQVVDKLSRIVIALTETGVKVQTQSESTLSGAGL